MTIIYNNDKLACPWPKGKTKYQKKFMKLFISPTKFNSRIVYKNTVKLVKVWIFVDLTNKGICYVKYQNKTILFLKEHKFLYFYKCLYT